MRNCKNPNWLYEQPRNDSKPQELDIDFRLDGVELVLRIDGKEKRVDLAPILAEISTNRKPARKRAVKETD